MKRNSGFTLIEVMMALAVVTIGAAALISMQGLTARSNMQSRQITIATDIAQTWAERIKLDAVSWTLAGGFANTVWLGNSAGNLGNWITPGVAPGLPLRSAAFDYYGRDVALGAAGAFFCTAYNYNWVAAPNGADPDETPAMRVDIRVYWPREGTGTVAGCNPLSAQDFVNFHSVGLPVVIRRSDLVQP